LDFARKTFELCPTNTAKIEIGVIKKLSVFVASKIAKSLNVAIKDLIQ